MLVAFIYLNKDNNSAMKNNYKLTILFAAGLLAFSSGVVLNQNKNEKYVETNAYSASSLPTTIDLNDTSAANIRSYYSSLNNLSTSERQGTNLLKNLKTILKNGQKYYSYENGTSIWQMYEITDRDWDKSPASSTTYGTYNSGTNKITNYTYGTSSSSSKNNPYIHALYINRDVTNQTTAWDNHNQDQWGINREHVWPKAEGFDSSGAGGARGDPMHLMAGNGYANNIHSNYYYGYVKTSSSYTDCGSKYSNQSGNLRGTSKTLNSGTVFEPQDSDKGDIARAIFYIVARYNYLSGSDSDGIDTNNPNLTLTQNISDWSSSGYTSSTSTQGKLGVLTDLLAWHHADPVDEYEIHRNNLLYTNFTNNRNPFIDFPEWADFIWGSVNYSGSTYISHSSTPTGYATPSSDTINGYNSGGATVSVTGVSLNKNSTSIEVGGAETLEATIAPSNASNHGVSWTSSNTSIATVSNNGTVRGVAEGNATITVTTSDGGYTATCTITVTAASGGGSGESETSSVTIQDYATANSWSNSTKYTSISIDENVTASVETGGANTGKYYTAGYEWRYYQTESAQIKISVASGYELDSVTFTFNVANTGALFDSSSNAVSSGTPVSLSGTSAIFTVGNSGSATNGQVKFTNISVTYHSTDTPAATLSSIAVKTAPTKTSYIAGEDFIPTGLVITATYSDSTTADIPYEDNEDSFEFDPSLNLQTSDVSVTISYGGKSTTQAITVSNKTLSSIAVQTAPTKLTYGEGEYFDPTGLVITLNYSNSPSEYVTYASDPSSFSFSPSTATALTTSNTSVTISYGGKSTTQAITVNAVTISASVSKTYYVGDTISSSDITVKDSLDNTILGFTFANDGYQFTYADATSGGSLTHKTFANAISYNTKTCSLTVQVQRKAHEEVLEETTWAKVTDASTLQVDDVIIIADSVSDLALSTEQRSSNRGAATITKSNNTITWEAETYEPQQLTLKSTSGIANAPSNSFGLYTGSGYLYAASSSSNQLKTQTTNNVNGAFVISVSDGIATIEATASSNRPLMRSNYSNNPSIFNCYASNSTTGHSLEIYKKYPLAVSNLVVH